MDARPHIRIARRSDVVTYAPSAARLLCSVEQLAEQRFSPLQRERESVRSFESFERVSSDFEATAWAT